ncbi:MAG TPA: 50S ribosomal protein L35 [Candidatus Atribacteria bacterium]|nr:50S ribosomal protein L35 [Candidatus Atribacteria bacterium]
MPKMKTHRGAAKRFKITATGKIKRGQAGKSHLLAHKDRDRKRRLKKSVILDKSDEKRVRKLLARA